MDPTETITWIRQLWDAGSVVVISIILFGNYIDIWMWHKVHKKEIDSLTKQLDELKASEKRWQDMALGLLTPVEGIADRLTTMTKGKRG